MTVDQIVAFLNEAVATDRQAMQDLLRATVPCNEALADHPTIVVWAPDETPDGKNRVGLGGLLMGIAALDCGAIASVWRTDDPENPTLDGFTSMDPRKPVLYAAGDRPE